MVDAVSAALSALFTVHGLVLLLLGTFIGTIVAIIPGLGSPVALAVLLPVTFTMSPAEALIFLIPIIGAGGFAGSMTGILVGVPGDETNAATTIDGHTLAKQGRAGEAIGASATSSALGALFGCLVLVLAIPFLRDLVLAVGPEEIFAVSMLGILMVGAVSASGGRLKGVASGFLGIALGLIGFNYALGGVRFTFGFTELSEGVPVVAALVGLFAIPEAISMLRERRPVSSVDLVRGGVRRGVMAALSRPGLLLRSSVLGTGIGMIPGIGGSISCWISYYAAQRTSKQPELFGRGSIEGVIGPEATIDAKDGGQLMPLLALGIPGGVTTAILAGAFLFHGIQPGPVMFTSQLSLVYLMVFALIFSNVSTSLLGLSFANLMVKVTAIPFYVVAPLVIALGATGSYVATSSTYGLWIFLIFGAIGYVMVLGGYSRAALVVGLILIPIIETNLHISLQSYRGSWSFLLRPGTLIVTAIGLLIFVGPVLLKLIRRSRRRDTAGPDHDTVVHSRRTAHAVVGGAEPPIAEGPLRLDSEIAAEEQPVPGTLDDSPGATLIMGLLGVTVGVFMLVQTFSLASDQRLVPMLALPVLIAVSALVTVSALRRPRSSNTAQGLGRRELALIGLVVMLPIVMWAVGFIAGLLAWTLAMMLLALPHQQRSRWSLIKTVIISVAFTVVVYVLVIVILDVRIPHAALL